jgi:hypothetical protein
MPFGSQITGMLGLNGCVYMLKVEEAWKNSVFNCSNIFKS